MSAPIVSATAAIAATTESSHSKDADPITGVPVPKDFGLLPVPRYLRYDPTKPPEFGLVSNIGFGLASTFIVANLYYCQPLLIQLSIAFGVTYEEVSRIPTLLQAGYAVGIVLITPLGDLIRRRQLLLGITILTTCLTIGLAVTSSLRVFEALSFLVGFFTVTPQILLPLAADLAPENKRAGAISVIASGLLFGVLLARVLAGIIAEFASWRVVYYFGIAVQGSVLVWSYFMVPDYPSKNKDLTYWNILWTMAKFSVTEPILIQAYFIDFASMACFANFWVTLTFLLGGPPYHYHTLTIGLFGLIGMVGVALAPLVGRRIDRVVPWYATLFGIALIILFQAIQIGAGGINVAALVIVCIGLDLCIPMIHVSLTTAIFGISLSARARLNAVFIFVAFLGQVMGISVGSHLFVKFGWRPAAAFSLGLQGFQLVVLLLRGPHCKRYTWFGYEGGLGIRKSVVERNPLPVVAEKTSESSYSSETAGHRDNKLIEMFVEKEFETSSIERGVE